MLPRTLPSQKPPSPMLSTRRNEKRHYISVHVSLLGCRIRCKDIHWGQHSVLIHLKECTGPKPSINYYEGRKRGRGWPCRKACVLGDLILVAPFCRGTVSYAPLKAPTWEQIHHGHLWAFVSFHQFPLLTASPSLSASARVNACAITPSHSSQHREWIIAPVLSLCIFHSILSDYTSVLAQMILYTILFEYIYYTLWAESINALTKKCNEDLFND